MSGHGYVWTALGHCGDALMEVIIVIFRQVQVSVSQPPITWGTFRPMTSHHWVPTAITVFKKWVVQCFSISPKTKAMSGLETAANHKMNPGGKPGLNFQHFDSRIICNPGKPEHCNRFQSPLKPDGQWSRQLVLLCSWIHTPTHEQQSPRVPKLLFQKQF